MLLPTPPANLRVSLALSGPPTLAEPLADALRAQWAWGFPSVPRGLSQLTHGFYYYPAGMQPVAVQHMLSVLPEGTLLDPFMGGGTTLVEAMRSGRTPIGADASPLSCFVAAHQTWRPTDEELEQLRAQAAEAVEQAGGRGETEEAEPTVAAAAAVDGARARPKLERGGGRGQTTYKSWQPLREQVERLAKSGADSAEPTDLSLLWFCFAAAQQRAERLRLRSPLAAFEATVESYCAAACALRAAVPSSVPPSTLLRADARGFELPPGSDAVDAICTSPPYLGVYDYLSHAREVRARLGATGDAPLMGLQGTPTGRDWPSTWSSGNEFGARKAMRKSRVPGEATAAWEADQRAWLGAAKRSLRAGGRAAILVGDGECSLDALRSTSEAAEEVGLATLASASIRPAEPDGRRQKGRRRPEHVLLLEA